MLFEVKHLTLKGCRILILICPLKWNQSTIYFLIYWLSSSWRCSSCRALLSFIIAFSYFHLCVFKKSVHAGWSQEEDKLT